MTDDPHDLIRALPIWHGPIDIAPLEGGITNRNFRVTDIDRTLVVRLGSDIEVHGVMRFNEHAASRAAAAAGISPAVRHAGPGILAIDHIEGRTLAPADIAPRLGDIAGLIRRAHRDVTAHLRGPILAFNVFHILRHYTRTLAASPHAALLPRLSTIAAGLEVTAGADRPVLAHNDLLAGNLIDDGARLWLIDWDYAGFNTPLFDLAGLSSNNDFTAAQSEQLLAAYHASRPDRALLRRHAALVCASLLRETLWSMVSELHSAIDFDYAAYSRTNLDRFERAWADFEERP